VAATPQVGAIPSEGPSGCGQGRRLDRPPDLLQQVGRPLERVQHLEREPILGLQSGQEELAWESKVPEVRNPGTAKATESSSKAPGSVQGFNVGLNVGEVAGQTVAHAHFHLIPRRKGDVVDPRGGIRGVVPGKVN
jgi:hypothetical protein